MNEPTFRSVFRKAIGEAHYPAGLSNRVEVLINARGDIRSTAIRGRGPFRVSVGRLGSLVAALLVVLLIASVMVGIHVWRDRSLLNTSPAAPTFDPVEIARLTARPLILPVVPPGGACPVSYSNVIDPGGNSFSAIGEGPMYVTGQGLQRTTKWGGYYDPTYYAGPQLSGIVLVRIRDLRTGRAGVFVGRYAAGTVVGTDTIDGKAVQQHGYAILDASRPPATSGTSKWGIWQIRQGWPTGWSGCWGFQLDGPDFSEVLTGVVTPGGN
jgi:hypothetical protein